MIEISSKKLELKKKNQIILKNIELDSSLNCFILIDTVDEKFGEIVLNKLLDSIIGKISIESAYKDLSIALENTNTIIKSWKSEEGIKGDVNILVAVLEDKNLIFSTIGLPSCYLIKKDNEIVEITEKDDGKKEFSFISNGEIKSEEIVIMCSDKLLHHVSRSDIIDSLEVENLDDVSSNLEITILEEKVNKNLGFIVIKNSYFKEIKDEPLFCIRNYCFRAMDNNFIKKTIALYLLLKDKIAKQKKGIKTGILLLGILLSFYILYSTISGIAYKTAQNNEVVQLKKDLQNAKDLVKLASENVNNSDIFNENIKKAEVILDNLRDKNMYITDVEAISETIVIAKKQYNLVETFEERSDNMIYKTLATGTIKLYNLNGSLYSITSKSVMGPISKNKEVKEFIFNDFGNDSFVDITSIDGNIFLTTKKGRVVLFEKNGFFKFYDVKGQTKWEDFKSVATYSSYLYTLSTSGNQIYKHRKFGQEFEKGTPYLDEKNKDNQNVIDIGIDGGIYLLKKDLSISKAVRGANLKVENLKLNKFPKNYEIEAGTTTPKIVAGASLKYIYLFLNNKIWILKPDSTNFSQTKSLTYVGQIDGVSKIIDFSINRDGEVQILNKNGIFRVNFEVSDGKLILK